MKDQKKDPELDGLIDACLDGRLSEEEAEKLSTLIEVSGEARDRYWELALVHGMLEQGLQTASIKAATGEEPAVTKVTPGRFFPWPRLTAAAASILIGIFSASVVWAYKAPLGKRSLRETTEFHFESFEDPSVSYSARFPRDPGVWHGELSVIQAPEGIEAMRGSHVARVSPVSERKFSYARRIVDLSELPEAEEGKLREIEVQASFLGSNPDQPSQFQIRLGVFSEEPEAVRSIWNNEAVLFDRILLHVGENHTTGPDEAGWHKMRTAVEIPPHARSLVVSLAVADAGENPARTDHYLDAIRFRLIESSVLPD
jgi:hypothetical protein